MIALEERVQPRDAEYLCSPLVSTAVVVGAVFIFGLVYLSAQGARTVLLTPVHAQFQAVMIAVGVFAGVWIAAIVREFWQLGIRLDGPIPEGIAVVTKLMVLVATGGWCGYTLAHQITEWRGFHGFRSSVAQESFIVTGFTNHRRGARSLNLIAASGAPPVAIGCDVQDCRGLGIGDRLTVKVETGRDGVQRAVFPGVVSAHADRG